MIIRSASLNFMVTNVSVQLPKLIRMVEDLNGYVVSSRMSGQYAWINVMVPSDSLDDFIQSSKKTIAKQVQHEEIFGTDVTDEYKDTTIRLKNLEATHKKLLELMDRAQTVEETLRVQRELTVITEQIELRKARLLQIEKQVSFSSVSFNLQEEYVSPAPPPQPPNRFVAAFKKAVDALLSTVAGMGEAAVWCVVFGLPLSVVFMSFYYCCGGKKVIQTIRKQLD